MPISYIAGNHRRWTNPLEDPPALPEDTITSTGNGGRIGSGVDIETDCDCDTDTDPDNAVRAASRRLT
jgi:hypothetical protein